MRPSSNFGRWRRIFFTKSKKCVRLVTLVADFSLTKSRKYCRLVTLAGFGCWFWPSQKIGRLVTLVDFQQVSRIWPSSNFGCWSEKSGRLVTLVHFHRVPKKSDRLVTLVGFEHVKNAGRLVTLAADFDQVRKIRPSSNFGPFSPSAKKSSRLVTLADLDQV